MLECTFLMCTRAFLCYNCPQFVFTTCMVYFKMLSISCDWPPRKFHGRTACTTTFCHCSHCGVAITITAQAQHRKCASKPTKTHISHRWRILNSTTRRADLCNFPRNKNKPSTNQTVCTARIRRERLGCCWVAAAEVARARIRRSAPYGTNPSEGSAAL